MYSRIILLCLIAFISTAAGADDDTCIVKNSTCSPGIMLPTWMPQENVSTGDKACRALVYFLVLCYMFLGVSIIADRFMTSIEVITSKEKAVKIRKVTGEETTILVRVWNETVSNLTLMALGSSAPEILLSVIEIVKNNFSAGELGPGTIVGSAAFNLYIIVAICVVSVPTTQSKSVKHIIVFWVTVIWSIFAYIWLYLIIAVISEGRVDVWEGIVTFLFFPLTVLTSYIGDKKMFGIFGHKRVMGADKKGVFSRPGTGATHTTLNNSFVTNGDIELQIKKGSVKDVAEAHDFEEHRTHYIEIFKNLRAAHPEADIDTLESLAEQEVIKMGPKSRAFYRIQATRKLMGGGNVMKKRIHEIEAERNRSKKSTPAQGDDDFGIITARFDPGHYTCMENVGTVYTTVVVSRAGIYESCVVEVDFRTVDDSATAGDDYKGTQGTLVFYPNEDRKHIGIDIVDNDIYEEDETFCVHLENLRARTMEGKNELPSQLKTPFVATVLIVDNDHAGAFGFENEREEVNENVGEFKLKVLRTRGARGNVSVHYKTVDGTAKSGEDFIEQEGTLYFHDEQPEAEISIPIINDDTYEKKEHFFVELSAPVWEDAPDLGALSPDGSETKTDADIANEGRPVLSPIYKCKVEIIESKEFKGFVDRMLTTANTSLIVGSKSWKEQFAEALSVDAGGDDEDEDELEPKCFDYVMHALTLPWKLLFALVPPTEYAGGWLCFVVSIVMIGIMTALIGDLASHFGCTVGLQDAVTAISIVALGTSLPDTFASKTAALQDENADACIVNVTGSNAVNVFLGIGIAWAMAAIYHAIEGTPFTVSTGALGFSVTLYCIGAIICVVILQVRRYAKPIRGELGGRLDAKIATFLIFLAIWVAYVVLSSLQAYCIIDAGF